MRGRRGKGRGGGFRRITYPKVRVRNELKPACTGVVLPSIL